MFYNCSLYKLSTLSVMNWTSTSLIIYLYIYISIGWRSSTFSFLAEQSVSPKGSSATKSTFTRKNKIYSIKYKDNTRAVRQVSKGYNVHDTYNAMGIYIYIYIYI